jgi:hypothetical protein
MGSLLLALASGFLGGVTLLASGVGLAKARRVGALRVLGVVTLLAVVALGLLSGITFLWLAMLTHASSVSAFTLGASFGARGWPRPGGLAAGQHTGAICDRRLWRVQSSAAGSSVGSLVGKVGRGMHNVDTEEIAVAGCDPVLEA